MKKNHLFLCSKICMLALAGAGAFFLASCATDGFDNDEQWERTVRNTLLSNPSESDITIEPTVDRKQTKISWNVVYGAAQYECKVYDITDGKKEQLLDTIMDGVTWVIPRVRNLNYLFTIRTIADSSLGNTSPTEPAEKKFDTLLEIFATIEGSDDAENPTDLYQYFKDNPITNNIYLDESVYNLQAGKFYTVSEELDFGASPGKSIMLRSEDETQRVNLTIGDNAGFVVPNEFSLENINITCGISLKPLIALNASPDASLKPVSTADDGTTTKLSDYYRINSLSIKNCDIMGLKGCLIYDNKAQYCIVGLSIDNMLLKLDTETDAVQNGALLSFYGGGVKEFTITNSTVYQTGSGNPQYFLRYLNGARIDRFGYNSKESQYAPDKTKITYINNTFYKVASGNWSNYDGIENGTDYVVQQNIWEDCGGSGEIARRIYGKSRVATEENHSTALWNYNTYVTNGAIKPQENSDGSTKYDTSNTQLQTLPGFKDPANGDFTPTGADQVQYKTGDPRWFE